MFRVVFSILTMACVTLAVSINAPMKQDNNRNVLNDLATKMIGVVQYLQDKQIDSQNNNVMDYGYYIRCLNSTKPSSYLESLKLCGNLKIQNVALDKKRHQTWSYESNEVEARGEINI